MTVETLEFTQTHDGDGTTTAFAYSRPFDAPADLKATIIDAGGVRRTPTWIATAGENGATVTITSETPAVGETVLIERVTTLLQKTNYSAGAFPSQAHEDMADRLTMAAQERRAVEARMLRVGPEEAELPPIDVLAPDDVLIRTAGGFGKGPSASQVASAQSHAVAAGQSQAAVTSMHSDVTGMHGAVSSWHSVVGTWHQAVDGWRQTVATQHGEVQTWRGEVQTWRGEVQTWHGAVAGALQALVGSVGDTPPAEPALNSFWFKTSAPFGLFVYYDDGDSQQYVQVSGLTQSGGGGDGASAYEVAVANGFVGDEAAWLQSLVGPPGDMGPPGANVTITVAADQAAFDAATPAATELVVLYA